MISVGLVSSRPNYCTINDCVVSHLGVATGVEQEGGHLNCPGAGAGAGAVLVKEEDDPRFIVSHLCVNTIIIMYIVYRRLWLLSAPHC